ATHLVHAGDVHVARDFVGGNLDVAGFAAVGRNLMRSRPSRAVISGEGGEEAANVAAIQDVVVVPRGVDPPEKRRGWVVLSRSGLRIVREAAVHAEMGPAIRVPRSGGLDPARPPTAAGRVRNPDAQPSGACLVVETNGVATDINERALTIGLGEASERGATVGAAPPSSGIEGVAASPP